LSARSCTSVCASCAAAARTRSTSWFAADLLVADEELARAVAASSMKLAHRSGARLGLRQIELEAGRQSAAR